MESGRQVYHQSRVVKMPAVYASAPALVTAGGAVLGGDLKQNAQTDKAGVFGNGSVWLEISVLAVQIGYQGSRLSLFGCRV